MILPAAGAVNSLPAAAGQGSGKFNSRTTALIFIKRRWLFISDVLFLNFISKLGADSVVQFCENCKLSQVSRVKLKFDINSIKCRN